MAIVNKHGAGLLLHMIMRISENGDVHVYSENGDVHVYSENKTIVQLTILPSVN